MATVVLQVAGAALGAAVGGPAGAMIGRALGAYAGYRIDQQVFGREQVIRGGRLEQSRLLASSEGAPIARAYGRVRLGGQVIWATRFREVRRKKKRSGGKGGGSSVTTVNYSYYASFAVGICEGEVSHVGRIWADGSELDRGSQAIRIYHGSEDQQPDPLIEAKQGHGKAPAFRGTAYAVFEDFPLARFGNRIPQISFEIIRSVAAVDRQIRSVNLIPGSTEHGYAPYPVRSGRLGRTHHENRNTLVAASDWQASLDELQAICPNLESVALVVAWFGDDLRAGNCRIEPRVVGNDGDRASWSVSGISRSAARPVSENDGEPAYGGTPDDASVIAAIRDLKARGLKVAVHPFIMMDVPAGNGLADPWGGNEQPAYPWRGRITCHPAPGKPQSPDHSATARDQVAALLGNAQPGDFVTSGDSVAYNGPADFGLRRMVLHQAYLCVAAGGVDTFLLFSELCGLTRIRDEHGGFPFIEGMIALAGDVRQILGPNTAISYGADWSEYFGYHPPGGDHDVLFNLDPFWADTNVDFVGIDNYMPLADWRETGDPGMAGFHAAHDVSYLQANILGGEGHGWYYASEADRLAASRTPITDGEGEEWIWAFKNLPAWWASPHHDRIGGVRSPQPTAWVPKSKPIRFTELGCPAINRGANQPNVFFDAKSSESALPRFSLGARDDLMALRYAQAQLTFWSVDASHADAINPVSPVYEARMIEPPGMSFWAWDARPYPSFPQLGDVWGDGANWYRGHWLNGRLGTCPLDDLLRAIFADLGMGEPLCEADGHVTGYVIGNAGTLRNALELLLEAFAITAVEQDGELVLRGKARLPASDIDGADLVQEGDSPARVDEKAPVHELPGKVVLSHTDVETNYNPAVSDSGSHLEASRTEFAIELPAVIDRGQAAAIASARLRDAWAGRDKLRFSLAPSNLEIEAGDLVSLDGGTLCKVVGATHGRMLEIEAAGFRRFEEVAAAAGLARTGYLMVESTGKPAALLMNLPLGQSKTDPDPVLYAAVFGDPWAGNYTILRSPADSGYAAIAEAAAPAIMFELAEPLAPGPFGRWDRSATLVVETSGEGFESLERLLVLEGRNAIALETSDGGFEILQFMQAELMQDGRWRLSGLLRGQLGTDAEMASGSPAGSLGVLLDDAIVRLPVERDLAGLPLNYRILADGLELGSPDAVAINATCTHISTRPLSPVHLRAVRQPDGHALSWIRRSRLDTGDWDQDEVPLDAASERYRVSILSIQGVLLRQWQVERRPHSMRIPIISPIPAAREGRSRSRSHNSPTPAAPHRRH